jgi:hypothetical protein
VKRERGKRERESTAKAKHMKWKARAKRVYKRAGPPPARGARGASGSVISKIIIIISGDSSSSSNNCKFEGTCKRYFLCGKKYFSKYKEVLLSA